MQSQKMWRGSSRLNGASSFSSSSSVLCITPICMVDGLWKGKRWYVKNVASSCFVSSMPKHGNRSLRALVCRSSNDAVDSWLDLASFVAVRSCVFMCGVRYDERK